MKVLGNIIWLVFGGLLSALEYLLASLFLTLTIIGIPFAIQTLKLAQLTLWPFGKETQEINTTTGCLSTFMNIIWVLFAGIWIALSHLFFALILTITIIGIPFAIQHLKLARLALMPFGREIVKVRKP